MNDTVKLFYEHAGYGYDPRKETAEDGRMRTAKSLARAAEWLAAQPHTVEWLDEPFPDRSHLPKRDRRPLFCCVVKVLTADGWKRESLHNIDLGKTGTECPEYMVVVVAELALELMPE